MAHAMVAAQIISLGTPDQEANLESVENPHGAVHVLDAEVRPGSLELRLRPGLLGLRNVERMQRLRGPARGRRAAPGDVLRRLRALHGLDGIFQ